MILRKNRTLVIAEMAQGYEGSFDTARALVRAAIAAQADAVKLQVFTADELATPDHEYYWLYKKLEFTPEKWGELIVEAQAAGLAAYADVFGVVSAAMLMEQGIDGFKVHSADVKNPVLLEFLGKSGKPVILSLGGSTKEEVDSAIRILKQSGAPEIVGMYGFQSFPTLIEHTRLNKMKLWMETLDIPVGFADHIDGDHRLRYDLCFMAMGMGASVIEKHYTLDRTQKLEDYESALGDADLAEFVSRVRELDAAFGEPSFEFEEPELKYRKNMKKHIVAAHDLAAGTVIGERDVVMKRTPEDCEFQNKEDIVGKTLKQDVKKDKVIRLEMLG